MRWTPEEAQALRDRVRANHDALQACEAHAFRKIALAEGRSELMQRYRCAACGGEVDGHAFHWYSRGLAHASAP